jgi:hypothetical protein
LFGWQGADGGRSWSCWRGVLAPPISCSGVRTRRHCAARGTRCVCRFFQMRAQGFDAYVGDACGCRTPIGCGGMAIFAALWLHVKTIDFVVSTTVAYASLTSWGRLCGAPILPGLISMASAASLGSSWSFFYLSLNFFVRGSPYHFVSVRWCVTVFIKRGKRLFRGV